MLTSYVESSLLQCRVQSDIESWPVGIYADFLRLIHLMESHGADLRMPHSRAMGQGLFELRCIALSRKHKKHLNVK